MFCLSAFSITVDDTSVILIPDLCVWLVFAPRNTWESPLYLQCSKISWWCALIYGLFHSQYCTPSSSFQPGKFWEISFYDFDNFLPPLLLSSFFFWNSFELKDEFHGQICYLTFSLLFSKKKFFFFWCSKRLYHLIYLVFNLPIIFLYFPIFLSWMQCTLYYFLLSLIIETFLRYLVIHICHLMFYEWEATFLIQALLAQMGLVSCWVSLWVISACQSL